MATDPEGHAVQFAISSTLPDGVFFNIDETSGVVTLAHAVDSDPPNNHAQLMFEVCMHWSSVHSFACAILTVVLL